MILTTKITGGYLRKIVQTAETRFLLFYERVLLLNYMDDDHKTIADPNTSHAETQI